MAEALRPSGSPPAYLPPLLTLAAVGGATQGELAKAVAIQQPTMALTLRRMERDGLVTWPTTSTGRGVVAGGEAPTGLEPALSP